MIERNPTKLAPDEFAEVVKKTPLVSIDMIVENQKGQVLLGLRKNEPAKGCWFVPGGRVFKDELISEALVRIAKEELGIDIAFENAEFVGVFEHLYPTNFAEKEKFNTHYVVLTHRIKIQGDQIDCPDDQHSQCRWFDKEEIINNPKVHANTRAYYEKQ